MKYGFDNAKYLKIQSEHIKERIAKFGDKLYMEFGGKLFDDYHASRVLPGFEPDSKLQMLMQLKDELEMIIVISAVDIEKNKMRADLGITYDMDVLRLRDEFMARGFSVNSVVITHFNGQASAEAYRKRLENMDIKVYYHYTIEGYPNNVSLIDSDEGFGRNDFVETTRPLVVVTAPGPGSGKMAVCLSQLYQENKRGVKAGYAKFETFAAQAPGEPRLRGRHGGSGRCEHDRPLPHGRIRCYRGKLQPRHRDFSGDERPVRGHLRGSAVQIAHGHGCEHDRLLHL